MICPSDRFMLSQVRRSMSASLRQGRTELRCPPSQWHLYAQARSARTRRRYLSQGSRRRRNSPTPRSTSAARKLILGSVSSGFADSLELECCRCCCSRCRRCWFASFQASATRSAECFCCTVWPVSLSILPLFPSPLALPFSSFTSSRTSSSARVAARHT